MSQTGVVEMKKPRKAALLNQELRNRFQLDPVTSLSSDYGNVYYPIVLQLQILAATLTVSENSAAEQALQQLAAAVTEVPSYTDHIRSKLLQWKASCRGGTRFNLKAEHFINAANAEAVSNLDDLSKLIHDCVITRGNAFYIDCAALCEYIMEGSRILSGGRSAPWRALSIEQLENVMRFTEPLSQQAAA
jgi:hypothetical protein